MYFILFMSLSLITKHVFFLFPAFILFKKQLPVKKKFCYAVLPPIIFLISFIPFVIKNADALNGVLNNVFFYRSFNNAPLLQPVYNLIDMPSNMKFYVYIIMMLLFALIIRERTYNDILLLYTIALVCFSSAIANQYLSIPLVALCVIKVGGWRYIYTIIAGIYLLLQKDGLGILEKLQTIWGDKAGWGNLYITAGYTAIAWILLFAIIYDQIYQNADNKENI